MKQILKVILITALVSLTSCGKDKETKFAGNNPEGNEGQLDKVILNVVVERNDTLSLYYSMDGSIDFTRTEPIWIPVAGSTKAQEVIYDLPDNVRLPQLRLDFGNNPKQEDIILNSVTFVYGQKIQAIKGREVFRYFRPDHARCKIDIATGAIIAREKNGVKLSPSLYPNEEILAKLMLDLSGK